MNYQVLFENALNSIQPISVDWVSFSRSTVRVHVTQNHIVVVSGSMMLLTPCLHSRKSICLLGSRQRDCCIFMMYHIILGQVCCNCHRDSQLSHIQPATCHVWICRTDLKLNEDFGKALPIDHLRKEFCMFFQAADYESLAQLFAGVKAIFGLLFIYATHYTCQHSDHETF